MSAPHEGLKAPQRSQLPFLEYIKDKKAKQAFEQMMKDQNAKQAFEQMMKDSNVKQAFEQMMKDPNAQQAFEQMIEQGHLKDLVKEFQKRKLEPGSPLTWKPGLEDPRRKEIYEENARKNLEKLERLRGGKGLQNDKSSQDTSKSPDLNGANKNLEVPKIPQSHLAMQVKVNEEIKAKVPRVDSNQLGLEAKAIPSGAKEGLTNQSREDFLKLRMEQIGQESAAFQANLVKELADLKAQGSVSNIIKNWLDGRNRASHYGDIPLPDGQDNDKKKDYSTGDLGGDTDPKPPTPQKNVGDGSGNVYSQPYAQNPDNTSESDTSGMSKDDLELQLDNIVRRLSQDDKRSYKEIPQHIKTDMMRVVQKTKQLRSQTEVNRENGPKLLLMLQNVLNSKEAYEQGNQEAMDSLINAIRELDEMLPSKPSEKQQEGQKLSKTGIGQNKNLRSVDARIRQQEAHPEGKGVKGKSS